MKHAFTTRLALAALLAAPAAALAQTGNVGVGTTTPAAPLHVVSNNFELLRLETVPGIAGPHLGLLAGGDGGSAYIDYISSKFGDPARAGVLEIRAPKAIFFNATNTGTTPELALIGGRLGVGTGAPLTPLEVQAGPPLSSSTVNTASLLRLTRLGTGNDKWNSSVELALGTYAPGVNSQSQLDFRLGNGFNANADQNVLTLRGDGRVGMGTTTPLTPLEVRAGTPLDGTTGSIGTASLLRLTRPGTGSRQPGSVELAVGTYATGNASQSQLDVRLGDGPNALADQPALTLRGNGQAGLGTNTPDATAALDITSTSRGLLPPRLSLGQRDGIGSPAAGLVIFNTTSTHLNYYDGSAWRDPVAVDVSPTYGQVKFDFDERRVGTVAYTVPPRVTALLVDMAGAAGGLEPGSGPAALDGYHDPNGVVPGHGGRVQATLAVKPGQVIYVTVGGAGKQGDYGASGAGYNGGGYSKDYNGNSSYAYCGGGASDIRVGAGGLGDRVLVAGGGGGGSFSSDLVFRVGNVRAGGAGGGLVGGTGGGDWPGLGGNQASGGLTDPSNHYVTIYNPRAVSPLDSAPGTLGAGGIAQGGGGGGGGYYGGAGGNGVEVDPSSGQTFDKLSAGGGGSSYAGAGTSAVVHTQGYRQGSGYVYFTPVDNNYPAPVLDASHFVNGPWTKTGTVVQTTVPSDGVGIGTSSPAAQLEVDLPSASDAASLKLEHHGSNLIFRPYNAGSSASIIENTAGNLLLEPSAQGCVGINQVNPTYRLDVGGSIYATGVIVSSDQRFKTDVRPLANALAGVRQLRGVRYRLNTLGLARGGNPGEQVGFLAQELEQVYPELVSTDRYGYKSVNYSQLTAVLTEALKEQQTQIEALQAQLNAQTATQQTDHAALLSLQAQLARLLGENPGAAPAASTAGSANR